MKTNRLILFAFILTFFLAGISGQPVFADQEQVNHQILGVAKGGTGARTAAGARTALGITSADDSALTGDTTIENASVSINLDVAGTATVAGKTTLSNASASGNLDVTGDIQGGAFLASDSSAGISTITYLLDPTGATNSSWTLTIKDGLITGLTP